MPFVRTSHYITVGYIEDLHVIVTVVVFVFIGVVGIIVDTVVDVVAVVFVGGVKGRSSIDKDVIIVTGDVVNNVVIVVVVVDIDVVFFISEEALENIHIFEQ